MVYRALFTIAAYLNLEIEQVDIKSAFSNVLLDKDIYIIQPIGYKNGSTKVYKLNKALYRLKQAARQFYIFLSEILRNIGYISIEADDSVYYNPSISIIIASYIDDLLIFATSKKNINILKEQVSKIVEISDLEDISHFLDINITRN